MDTMQDAPEKVVYIKRKQTFIEEANADPEVQEYFDMSFRAIGSYYKITGKQFGSGLQRWEEELLLPELVGVYPEEDRREYHRAVKDFYRNINTKIPGEGLRLNIALHDENEPLSEKNLPVSVRDFVIYRHALNHPETGKTFDEAEMYQHKRFYIEDTDSVVNNAAKLSKMEDKALLSYYEISDSPQKIEQTLVLHGVNPKDLNEKEQQLKAKEFATINETESASENEAKLKKFISITGDKRLETKYLIEEMISINILERVGMKVLIRESGDLIGDSMQGAALWFEDKVNSAEINVLKAKYKELRRPSKRVKKAAKPGIESIEPKEDISDEGND